MRRSVPPSKRIQDEFRRAYRRMCEAQDRLRAAEARVLRAFGGNWERSAAWRHRMMDRVDREMSR